MAKTRGTTITIRPPAVDWKINSEGCLQQAMLTRGVLQDTLQLTLDMPAPADAEARQARRLDARLDVVMTISLPHESAWLDVAVEVNNTLRDHRLQIELPTGVHQATHFADQPFGLIERENVPRALEIWQQENWTEAPASLWPMQSLVMMHHARRGLGVVTAGLREYEIPVGQPDTLAITLFRSVGWLGQPALEWRPGRASGMVLPAPDSQIPGRHAFHFAVMPMDNGQSPAFWQAVEQWRTPASGYLDSGWSRFRTNPHGKSFPPHFSVLSWESPLHFSTLKKAQNEDALVLRGWNPGLTKLDNRPPTANGIPQQITLAERPATPTDSVAAGTPVSWLIRSFE
ncbi:Mannosylglycerate hydrolase [Cedecea neteri]|uniref:Mannosylglycerate hydrolase n=1 Tax=Cedecea neteri TaxID=158822 RepID=A0A2X3IW79_9ENTR|nr:Mannosylglycerate hydrolase [Cedecea neteri]